jgi:hypothetical protein
MLAVGSNVPWDGPGSVLRLVSLEIMTRRYKTINESNEEFVKNLYTVHLQAYLFSLLYYYYFRTLS